MTKKILIGGEWMEAAESFPVKNPYSGKILAEVYAVDETGLETAIAAAEIGANAVRELPRYEIAKGLRNIAAEIEKRKTEFAETIAKESAKPIKLAVGEVERGIATFNWAAGEAERFVGEVVPIDTIATGKGKTAYTKRIPRGEFTASRPLISRLISSRTKSRPHSPPEVRLLSNRVSERL